MAVKLSKELILTLTRLLIKRYKTTGLWFPEIQSKKMSKS